MQTVILLCLSLLLLTLTSVPIEAQGRSPLLDKVVHSVKKKAPQWHFIPGVCTCPPLVPSQKSYASGGWHLEDRKGKPRHVGIYVSEVPSAEEATAWMEGVSWREVAAGWQRERYWLGDEASLLRNEDGTSSTIYFRTGHVIIEVSGALREVERFARYIAEELAASEQVAEADALSA